MYCTLLGRYGASERAERMYLASASCVHFSSNAMGRCTMRDGSTILCRRGTVQQLVVVSKLTYSCIVLQVSSITVHVHVPSYHQTSQHSRLPVDSLCTCTLHQPDSHAHCRCLHPPPGWLPAALTGAAPAAHTQSCSCARRHWSPRGPCGQLVPGAAPAHGCAPCNTHAKCVSRPKATLQMFWARRYSSASPKMSLQTAFTALHCMCTMAACCSTTHLFWPPCARHAGMHAQRATGPMSCAGHCCYTRVLKQLT